MGLSRGQGPQLTTATELPAEEIACCKPLRPAECRGLVEVGP